MSQPGRVVTFKPGQKLKARVESHAGTSSDIRSSYHPFLENVILPLGRSVDLCEVKPHVLRYWEQEFPSLSPAESVVATDATTSVKMCSLIRQIRSLALSARLYHSGELGSSINGRRCRGRCHAGTHQVIRSDSRVTWRPCLRR